VSTLDFDLKLELEGIITSLQGDVNLFEQSLQQTKEKLNKATQLLNSIQVTYSDERLKTILSEFMMKFSMAYAPSFSNTAFGFVVIDDADKTKVSLTITADIHADIPLIHCVNQLVERDTSHLTQQLSKHKVLWVYAQAITNAQQHIPLAVQEKMQEMGMEFNADNLQVGNNIT
jgi:hypothetical protein